MAFLRGPAWWELYDAVGRSERLMREVGVPVLIGAGGPGITAEVNPRQMRTTVAAWAVVERLAPDWLGELEGLDVGCEVYAGALQSSMDAATMRAIAEGTVGESEWRAQHVVIGFVAP